MTWTLWLPAGTVQRVEDPRVRGKAIQGRVEPTCEAEVGAQVGSWLNVEAVHADGRRAEKALALGGFARSTLRNASSEAWLEPASSRLSCGR